MRGRAALPYRLLDRFGRAILVAALLFGLSSMALGQDANTVIAQIEMQTLAQGEEIAALFTQFYVSLESLNDLTFPTIQPYDFINEQGGAFVIRPTRGLFDSSRRFMDPVDWGSGFVIFQPGTTQLGTEPYDQGSPLDPWGTPYYFYTPHGLVRGDNGVITQEHYGDAFDRYTIVSFGSDGVMSGDDLFREFNGSVTTQGLSSLSGSKLLTTNSKFGTTYNAVAGSSLTIRGYNFGSSQGAKKVMLGSTELSDVLSWSSTQIELQIPADFVGSGGLHLDVGGGSTNSLALSIAGPMSQAKYSLRYR